MVGVQREWKATDERDKTGERRAWDGEEWREETNASA